MWYVFEVFNAMLFKYNIFLKNLTLTSGNSLASTGATVTQCTEARILHKKEEIFGYFFVYRPGFINY
jgi:hypothetical protein